jgi:hypothetical protein
VQEAYLGVSPQADGALHVTGSDAT